MAVWQIDQCDIYFRCSFSSHVRWSSRRFLPRTRVSTGSRNVATSASTSASASPSSSRASSRWAAAFLPSVLALSIRIDVVKFSLDSAPRDASFRETAFGTPLGRVMMTLFTELIIRHATWRYEEYLSSRYLPRRPPYRVDPPREKSGPKRSADQPERNAHADSKTRTADATNGRRGLTPRRSLPSPRRSGTWDIAIGRARESARQSPRTRPPLDAANFVRHSRFSIARDPSPRLPSWDSKEIKRSIFLFYCKCNGKTGTRMRRIRVLLGKGSRLVLRFLRLSGDITVFLRISILNDRMGSRILLSITDTIERFRKAALSVLSHIAGMLHQNCSDALKINSYISQKIVT